MRSREGVYFFLNLIPTASSNNIYTTIKISKKDDIMYMYI